MPKAKCTQIHKVSIKVAVLGLGEEARGAKDSIEIHHSPIYVYVTGHKCSV